MPLNIKNNYFGTGVQWRKDRGVGKAQTDGIPKRLCQDPQQKLMVACQKVGSENEEKVEDMTYIAKGIIRHFQIK